MLKIRWLNQFLFKLMAYSSCILRSLAIIGGYFFIYVDATKIWHILDLYIKSNVTAKYR